MMYFAGVDVGSVASKALVVDEEGNEVSYAVVSGLPGEQSARQVIDEALEDYGLSFADISRTVATGYGRVNVPFADKQHTEIICHSVGVNSLFPSVRTVIDIGGQDSKAIKVSQSGRVEHFIMNDKCAAGTGRFLEVMEGVLNVGLDRWGELASKATNTASISSVCTVFAETEVISKVAQNVPMEDIVAGVCESIAYRVAQMAKRVAVEKDVCLTGGVAQNQGVARKLSEILEMQLLIADRPQRTGALGAALIALRSHRKDSQVGLG
jgi:predicted CoA-substrate-specific enzyme activase